MKVLNGFIWKFLERCGTTVVQFIIQIVLARLLAPEYYGSLSIMLIFINLANAFVHSGFNTALIQKREVEEEDYSSVFWFTLVVSILLYGILYFCIPLILKFYNMLEIEKPFKILALILILGTYQSIPNAIVTKRLQFRTIFLCTIGANLFSGIVGIFIAYLGYGLWALVFQSIASIVITSIVMLFVVKWFPKFKINFKKLKCLFSFGWKMLFSGLIDSLYQDLRSLVIGKKYDNSTLGFYNKGRNFPQIIMDTVNGTIQGIMFPIIASEQNDKKRIKILMRGSMTISSFFVLPAMAGLAAVATPLVLILLTDKWLNCVIFLQIYCIDYAFYPMHTCNLQTISAVGRSDIFLKLEIIKKIIGIMTIIVAVFCFDSPIAIALTGAITGLVATFINAYPNKKLIGYPYLEQVKDILPYLLMSLFMCGIVLLIGTLNINVYLLLVIQILSGILIYGLLSIIFKPEPYKLIIGEIKKFLNKRKEKIEIE